MENTDLSTKMLAYLAQIYRLDDFSNEVNHYVSTSHLADNLDVSAPAVNRMINKLRELGLLQHEPYQGIRLTPAGEQEALKYLRRYRIAEVFLVNVMGFTWEDVHDEAGRISSALSDAVTRRMYEMAGSPTHCPHGEPIPGPDGKLENLQDDLLSNHTDGGRVRLTRILTREPDRLQYMEALGLIPGVEFDVLHVAPFNGPMQLKLNDEYRIIGYNLAELIRVCPVE